MQHPIDLLELYSVDTLGSTEPPASLSVLQGIFPGGLRLPTPLEFCLQTLLPLPQTSHDLSFPNRRGDRAEPTRRRSFCPKAQFGHPPAKPGAGADLQARHTAPLEWSL